jgi:hypothetical protein
LLIALVMKIACVVGVMKIVWVVGLKKMMFLLAVRLTAHPDGWFHCVSLLLGVASSAPQQQVLQSA